MGLAEPRKLSFNTLLTIKYIKFAGVHFGVITFLCVLWRALILFIVSVMMKDFLALLKPEGPERVGRNAHGTLGHRP